MMMKQIITCICFAIITNSKKIHAQKAAANF